MSSKSADIDAIRGASRRLVREFGFMNTTLAGTDLPPSAVHALLTIEARGALTSGDLSDELLLEKSSVSRLTRKLIEAGEVVEKASPDDGRAKLLSLTRKGRATLAGINGFATRQVESALDHLGVAARHRVRDGLASYAGALRASRTGGTLGASRLASPITIAQGYRPGIIGKIVEMHARYYAAAVGFGHVFESKVASGLAEFAGRLDRRRNGLWVALHDDDVVGGIAIDGEDLGGNVAHLRWFIVGDGQRGQGIGRLLMREAMTFCEGQRFAEIQLWTFRGLDAARKLYEAHGFVLAEEQPGRQWGDEVIEQRFVRRSPALANEPPATA